MSILNRLLGTAQTTARSQAYGRTTRRPMRTGGLSRGFSAGRGMGMGRGTAAGRPVRRGRTPSTSASGLAGLVGGLLRRR
jgi:hypothetical protein